MLRCYALGCTALAASLLIPFHVDAIEFSTSTDSPVVLEVEEGSSLELDLEKAYEIALARNLDLQVGRYDLAIPTPHPRRFRHLRPELRLRRQRRLYEVTVVQRARGRAGQRDAQYGFHYRYRHPDADRWKHRPRPFRPGGPRQTRRSTSSTRAGTPASAPPSPSPCSGTSAPSSAGRESWLPRRTAPRPSRRSTCR